MATRKSNGNVRQLRKPKRSGPKPADVKAAAEKLLDVDQEIAEYEFRITGASGFNGGKDLGMDDVVQLLVGGTVKGVGTVLRKRHETGAGSEEEYLARVVTIKATGATIR